ncbi:unnamed protein product [Clonostachys rhizophaga]|uniref:FAD-binding domain-containing protein n=1 Tax=Clonostachys rhizophaga TaxID=160324 RepID=A0A9N9V2U5_9HYPO|nr:unnamed protein product [Clonostachys rhizophaga]
MAQLKVLIAGGGIAGNALAYWLSKIGHDITVVERFPCLRATGLQVDLRGHGVEVLKRMGLEQEYRSKKAPEQGILVVDSSGRRRATFPANPGSSNSLTTDFEIMRGDLCRMLHDAAVKHRTKFVFGKSIENFQQDRNAVHVNFSDGESDKFDLVVGADGQNSRLRKMMLGTGASDRFYPLGGTFAAYFTIPRPIQKGEEYVATTYMAPGKRAIMTRRANPDELQVYLFCQTDSDRLKNAHLKGLEEEKAAFEEIFQDAGWEARSISSHLKTTENFSYQELGVVKLPSWSQGRISLVGDAAFCSSVATGMGTTSAMVGAYVLAGEIGKHCGVGEHGNGDGIPRALEAYQETFHPMINDIQKGLPEKNVFKSMPSSSWGVSIANFILSTASFLGINSFDIPEYGSSWKLPTYKELS